MDKKEITKSKHFWRKNYPWFFFLYILMFGIMAGALYDKDHFFSVNILMTAAFISYIFLFVFYVYGVRPEELEPWHKKYKK